MRFRVDKEILSIIKSTGTTIVEASDGSISFTNDNGIITRYTIKDDLNQKERYAFESSTLLSFINEEDIIELSEIDNNVILTQVVIVDRVSYENSINLKKASSYFKLPDFAATEKEPWQLEGMLRAVKCYKGISDFQQIKGLNVVISNNEYYSSSGFTEIYGPLDCKGSFIISMDYLVKLQALKYSPVSWDYNEQESCFIIVYSNGIIVVVPASKFDQQIQKVQIQEPTTEYKILNNQISSFSNLLKSLSEYENINLVLTPLQRVCINYNQPGIIEFSSSREGHYANIVNGVARLIINFIHSNQDDVPVFILIEEKWFTIKLQNSYMVLSHNMEGTL